MQHRSVISLISPRHREVSKDFPLQAPAPARDCFPEAAPPQASLWLMQDAASWGAVWEWAKGGGHSSADRCGGLLSAHHLPSLGGETDLKAFTIKAWECFPSRCWRSSPQLARDLRHRLQAGVRTGSRPFFPWGMDKHQVLVSPQLSLLGWSLEKGVGRMSGPFTHSLTHSDMGRWLHAGGDSRGLGAPCVPLVS